ncbi:MAG: histidinol-phosphatase [Desulfamplus sp.]|nr:histidinol-phosphatase [Desulfamplus sp.]
MKNYQRDNIKKIKPVSVHGGHSGQFCNHAQNTLEEIILQYIESGFEWIGITEHIYPISNELRYPDEAVAGIDVSFLAKRFTEYMKTCRKLQEKYQDSITIFTAFETETYSEYKKFIPSLIQQFRPDYVVGSVHHLPVHNLPVNRKSIHNEHNNCVDVCIDYSKEYYDVAADALGGVENLYCRYFDVQYEMIEAIEPSVVGHFDLIRIFDEDYLERIKNPLIWQRITRNLELIKKKNLIMDFNLRALMKGAKEPYISAPILAEAKKMNISVVIGDDSHGVKDIGVNIEKGIDILRMAGFNTDWQIPKVLIALTYRKREFK